MDKENPIVDQELLEKINQKLERKTKEVEIIQQVSSQINATLNLQNIANTMLELMDEFFGFKHTMILLLEEKDEILNVLATHGYEEQGVGAKVKVGIGVIGMVAKRKKLMRMANLGAQRAYMQAVKEQVNQTTTTKIQEEEVLPGLQDVESQVAIPMMLEEKLVGVFSVESREINIFDKGDELLIGILANQAAIALQHARLFQREQQRLKELNEAHKELADLNSNLEQKVEERTAELMELSAIQQLQQFHLMLNLLDLYQNKPWQQHRHHMLDSQDKFYSNTTPKFEPVYLPTISELKKFPILTKKAPKLIGIVSLSKSQKKDLILNFF